MAQSPADLMTSYAGDAVRHARKACAMELDFSPRSIELLESAFDRLASARPTGFFARLLGLGPADRTLMAKMYGAYLGEVILRAHGGEWAFDRDIAPGAAVVCLRLGDRSLYPIATVQKRLKGSPHENLWSYYQGLRP